MSSQKKIGIAIFAALAIGVGGYFGYQHYASVPTAQEAAAAVDKIGIIDLTRAVKGHPRAAELEAIEYAMADLQSSAQQKMQRGMAMSMPSGLPMEISNNMTAGQQALIAEANQKIAAKQTELSKRIAEIGLAKEKARDEELAVSLRQISDEYKLRIFNYDLKLQALTLDDASRAKMEEEKNALERELFFKQQAKTNELEQKLMVEMQAEVKAAHEEMEAYAKQIHEEYNVMSAAKSEAANAEMMAKLQKMNRQLETEIKADQEAFNEKKKQHEEIKNIILQDIEAKVAAIAEEQGVTVVLRKVQINLTAVDLTESVIAACKTQQ